MYSSLKEPSWASKAQINFKKHIKQYLIFQAAIWPVTQDLTKKH